MEKKLYLEINYPDTVDFKKMDIEQLIYNEMRYRLEELGVSKDVLDDWKQFDVIVQDIEFLSR